MAAQLTGDEFFCFLKETLLYSSVKEHLAYVDHRHRAIKRSEHSHVARLFTLRSVKPCAFAIIR